VKRRTFEGSRLDYDLLGQEIRNGSSRAAIILAVAAVDDFLRIAIVMNMIGLSRTDEERIFGGNGPLASFSSRVLIGYATGLISRKLRTDLDNLRQIRNAYAHKTLDMNLSNPDQDRLIRSLNAVADIKETTELSINEILARAVEKIQLYLVMRTSPPHMQADSELLSQLRCLDYSNFVEIKRRADLSPYQSK
jgi:DNA-binding MltR family transcriptional regulator